MVRNFVVSEFFFCHTVEVVRSVDNDSSTAFISFGDNYITIRKKVKHGF